MRVRKVSGRQTPTATILLRRPSSHARRCPAAAKYYKSHGLRNNALTFGRLHEREQSAGGLLRVHPEFLVRRGAALPGRLGAAAGLADSTGAAADQPRRRAAATTVRLSAAAAASAAQVAVPARAVGRAGGQHAGAGL